MPTLKERIEKLTVKSDELQKVFDEAGPEMDMDAVKSIEGADNMTSEQKVAWIRERDAEINDLTDEVRDAAELEKSRSGLGQLKTVLNLLDQPANALPPIAGIGSDGGVAEAKSFGEAFIEAWSPELKGQSFDLEDFDTKTLFETTAGWAPESTRTGRVVPYAVAPLEVIDIIPTTGTGQAAVIYMEETTYTQAAAETAEGGAYGESEFALTERTSPVRKIAHFIPVTDEQLEDEPQVSGYLDNRMRFGIRQRTNTQILVGDGTAPNLEGILNRTGIQTQAKGTDPVPDAIYKAMTKIRVTGQAIPSHTIMHPNDWQDVRLLRTTDGIYIWGSPSEAGPERIWGLPVVQEQALTENTGLVGDFPNFAELAIRRGIEVKVSDSHSDYFVKGKQAIRADYRAALQVYRAAAFCTVTGI